MKLFGVAVISSLLLSLAINSRVEALNLTVKPDPDAPSYLFVDGVPFTFLKRGETTGGQYAIGEITIQPGQGALPHIHHQENEWFYVKEGNLQLMRGENYYPDPNQVPGVNAPKDLIHALNAPAGTLLYVEKDYIHGVLNVSQEPAKLQLIWTPAGFENIFIKEIGIPVLDPSNPPPPTSDYPLLFAEAARRYGVVGSFSYEEFGDIVVDNTLLNLDNRSDKLLKLLGEDATTIPEPSVLWGALIFGTSGAISIWKSQRKSLKKVA
ncbi:cupin 2 domain-containing protein [Nostoc sp. NIES-4103]|nr:cupin 2 domain-containing protein [Nostoc sp. NIES-4103]